jgi:hypothetical protein
MASIVIAGDTSGTVTLAAPATAGTTTLTLPTTNGTVLTTASTGISASNITTGTLPKAQLPAGTVLQVVSATKTDVFSTANASWTDVTGLSVSITPTSATNKILFLATVHTSNTTAGTRFAIRAVRDSTAICIGTDVGSRTPSSSANESRNATGMMTPLGVNFLDSPATTSSTTYKIQTNCIDGGTTVFNRGYADGDSSSVTRVASTITVMEIAA